MKRLPVCILYAAILITIPALAYSITLYVDDDPGCGGFSPCYSSLQLALNEAGEGDTVFIR